MNVFVTGAGGPAGVNVIRYLMANGHTVIAADCDPTAVGFHLAHRAELLPLADAEEFPEVLTELLIAHDVDVIASTIVEELAVLTAMAPELREIGVGHLGPSLEAIRVCSDKLAFAQAMSSNGVATPGTTVGSGRRIPGPWIVKPRSGRGSRDVHAVDDRRSLRAARTLTPNPIVQTRIAGREFSADTLVAANGEVLGIASRWRDACRGGISTAGTTFESAAVECTVTRALHVTGVKGAANVQGFVSDNDEVVIIEINPRFSGGLALSLAAGCDLVGQYVRAAAGLTIERHRLTCHPGVSMARHFDEVITAAELEPVTT